MKIIDLLNKIANGEEVPEKIIYDNELYVYNDEMKDYEYPEKCGWLMDISRNSGNVFLNGEVEITQRKEIEKIVLNSDGDIVYYENGEKHRFTTNKQTKYLKTKLITINKKNSKDCALLFFYFIYLFMFLTYKN